VRQVLVVGYGVVVWHKLVEVGVAGSDRLDPEFGASVSCWSGIEKRGVSHTTVTTSRVSRRVEFRSVDDR